MHARQVRPAVVALHLADPGKDAPRQPRTGLRGAGVPGQIARRDIGQCQQARSSGQPGTGSAQRRGCRDEQDESERRYDHGAADCCEPLGHGLLLEILTGPDDPVRSP